MDIALGWIGDLFRSLLSLFPHFTLVHATHGGVKFRNGHQAVMLLCNNGIMNSGVHIYWPLASRVEIVPIARQTNKLPPQYLVTRDGKTIGTGAIIIYEVSDVLLLLTRTWDHDQTINDYGMIAIRDVISRSTAQEISDANSGTDVSLSELDKRFTKLLRRRVKPFGVRVIRMALSDFAPVALHGLMLPHGTSLKAVKE